MLWFSLSWGVSVIIFAFVTILCFYFSGYGKRKTNFEKTPESEKQYVLDVMVFFEDEATERRFASRLTLDFKTQTVLAEDIDLNSKQSGKTLEEIYKTEGLYPFIEACNTLMGEKDLKFIKINSKTFTNITDRLGKIVYNDKLNNQTLLTSSQAERLLDAKNFSNICKTVARGVFTKDIEEEFLFIASTTQNDLSYPKFYSKIYHY